MKQRILILLFSLLCFSCNKESESLVSLTDSIWSNAIGKLQFNEDGSYWAENNDTLGFYVYNLWYGFRYMVEYQGQSYPIQKNNIHYFLFGNWELQDNRIQLFNSHIKIESSGVIRVNNEEIVVPCFPVQRRYNGLISDFIYTTDPNALDTIMEYPIVGSDTKVNIEYKYIYLEDAGSCYTGNVSHPIELEIEKLTNNSLILHLVNNLLPIEYGK